MEGAMKSTVIKGGLARKAGAKKAGSVAWGSLVELMSKSFLPSSAWYCNTFHKYGSRGG